MLRDILLNRSRSGKERRRGSAVGRLARSRKDIWRLFFRKQVRPSGVPRTYVRTCLLRPCGADRRMRFSRAPAYPSRDYLGRESSSLPRSFPSLLPIRGGARFPPERTARDRSLARARRGLTRGARGGSVRAVSPRATIALTAPARCHLVVSRTSVKRDTPSGKMIIPKGVGATTYSRDTCRSKVSENLVTRESHTR